MCLSSSISAVDGGAEIVIVGFLLGTPSPLDDLDLDSTLGIRDVLPLTIARLVAVAVCVTLKGLDTSKEVDFCDLRPRNGMAERCLEVEDVGATERREEGSAEKREVCEVSVAEVNEAPKEVGDTFNGGREGWLADGMRL